SFSLAIVEAGMLRAHFVERRGKSGGIHVEVGMAQVLAVRARGAAVKVFAQCLIVGIDHVRCNSEERSDEESLRMYSRSEERFLNRRALGYNSIFKCARIPAMPETLTPPGIPEEAPEPKPAQDSGQPSGPTPVQKPQQESVQDYEKA